MGNENTYISCPIALTWQQRHRQRRRRQHRMMDDSNNKIKRDCRARAAGERIINCECGGYTCTPRACCVLPLPAGPPPPPPSRRRRRRRGINNMVRSGHNQQQTIVVVVVCVCVRYRAYCTVSNLT